MPFALQIHPSPFDFHPPLAAHLHGRIHKQGRKRAGYLSKQTRAQPFTRSQRMERHASGAFGQCLARNHVCVRIGCAIGRSSLRRGSPCRRAFAGKVGQFCRLTAGSSQQRDSNNQYNSCTVLMHGEEKSISLRAPTTRFVTQFEDNR